MILYKAITIIQLAREWSAKLHRAVVPIFWIAGEDHDFDEVNHVYALSNTQQIEKLKVEHPTGLRTSVSRLPLIPRRLGRGFEQAGSIVDGYRIQSLLTG